MPQVSIIVPVYNVEAYVRQCLDSLIHQTFEDMEIIGVDDGSTDESGRILDAYALKDKRVRVIHKENSGYGHSMNVGLDHASGEYIAVVESDDFAEPDMVDKMYRAMQVSGADIVKARHYDYRGGQDYLCNLIGEFPKERVTNSMEQPGILKLAHTIWSCMYRRAFLVENNIRFHETKGASYQDISFAMQGWLKAQKVYFIEDAFLHYRNDNPNSSMHNPAKIFCVFEEYSWLEEKFQGFWENHAELEKYFVAQKYMDYFSHYYRVAMQYQYAFLLKFSEELKKDLEKNRLQEACYQPSVWSALLEIDRDINQFFLKSAKKLQDLRLEVCSFCNEESYKKGFLEAVDAYTEIFVYGAGKVGQKLADMLMENGISVTAFAVTAMDANLKEYREIPVIEVEKLKEKAEECAVILAVAERSQYELYQNLMKYGFKNVFRVDEIIRNAC